MKKSFLLPIFLMMMALPVANLHILEHWWSGHLFEHSIEHHEHDSLSRHHHHEVNDEQHEHRDHEHQLVDIDGVVVHCGTNFQMPKLELAFQFQSKAFTTGIRPTAHQCMLEFKNCSAIPPPDNFRNLPLLI